MKLQLALCLLLLTILQLYRRPPPVPPPASNPSCLFTRCQLLYCTPALLKPEDSNKCEVCSREKALLSCDTCPRFFHGNCHIPPKLATKNPWSCIFCQIKDLKKCCPESQPIYQESEILQKRMLPREQLKCEFLLLKVYCSPKSSFFVSEPHYTRDASQDLEEPMWLNKIKDKLMMTLYYQVWEFVRDMRLIFQNHKMVYRDSKFIGLGLQLETQFENDFKDIFGIQEISTNST